VRKRRGRVFWIRRRSLVRQVVLRRIIGFGPALVFLEFLSRAIEPVCCGGPAMRFRSSLSLCILLRFVISLAPTKTAHCTNPCPHRDSPRLDFINANYYAAPTPRCPQRAAPTHFGIAARPPTHRSPEGFLTPALPTPTNLPPFGARPLVAFWKRFSPPCSPTALRHSPAFLQSLLYFRKPAADLRQLPSHFFVLEP